MKHTKHDHQTCSHLYRSLGTRVSFGAGAIHQGASSRLRTYWCPRTDFAPACTWTGPEKLKLIGKSIMDCLSKNCGKEHCTPCPILPEKCGIDHAEVFKWRLTIGFTTMHILFFFCIYIYIYIYILYVIICIICILYIYVIICKYIYILYTYVISTYLYLTFQLDLCMQKMNIYIYIA